MTFVPLLCPKKPWRRRGTHGLAFKNVIADCYWCLLAQQPPDVSPTYLYQLANLITDLDPHFNVVYRCAALHLTLRAGRHDLADQLLRKGLRSPFNSADWRFYFYLGFHSAKSQPQRARFLRLASLQTAPAHSPILQQYWLAPPTHLAALASRSN